MPEQPVETIIRANEKKLRPDFRELWRFRDLLVMLTVRDIKLRYKQTLLGIIWVVLQPLATAAILAIVFGYFIRLSSEGVPYVIFVFCALLPWMMFAGIMTRAGGSVLKDAALVSKIYFPRLILPTASALAVLVDYVVTFVVLLVLLLVYRKAPSPNIVFLPVLTVLVFLIGLGCSFFFSAVSVYYRDFVHVLPFVVQIWFYASPIVYSIDVVPVPARSWYILNPWVGLINSYRWSVLGGEFPATSFAIAVVASLVCFLIGIITFQRIQLSFVDVV